MMMMMMFVISAEEGMIESLHVCRLVGMAFE